MFMQMTLIYDNQTILHISQNL